MTLYTRQGCGLCRDAEALLADLLDDRAELRTVDVDGDPALLDRYGVRVPVVAVDGVEVAEGVISPDVLVHALSS